MSGVEQGWNEERKDKRSWSEVYALSWVLFRNRIASSSQLEGWQCLYSTPSIPYFSRSTCLAFLFSFYRRSIHLLSHFSRILDTILSVNKQAHPSLPHSIKTLAIKLDLFYFVLFIDQTEYFWFLILEKNLIEIRLQVFATRKKEEEKREKNVIVHLVFFTI